MPHARSSNTRVRDRGAEERWYCVQTSPARETMAAEYLRSKNVSVYNPVLPASSRSGRRRPEQLFPRYLFARFALNHHFDAVRYAQGVASVISDMEGPLPVPDAIIEEIRQRLEHGFYSGGNLATGENVIVTSGVFKGITGIFQAYVAGQERVRVLMGLMNRSVLVECDLRDVKTRRQSAARH